MPQKPIIIQLQDFLSQKDKFIKLAVEKKIFIYPTDSIYGIGKIFNNFQDIKDINRIKKGEENQIRSIIAPNYQRIKKKFPQIDINFLKKMIYIYQNVTFIFQKDFPGIRILQHPIQDFFNDLGEAFISTSVNIHGKNFATTIEEIDKEILKYVDVIVDSGKLLNSPSTIIDLTNGQIIFR